MKKNLIVLVVDSFCYDIIGNSKYGESATPFLDELKKRCIFAENLYSQGPYTEAGLKGLLCGQDVMDEGGYMYRFNNVSNFVFDPFHEAGYEVFNAYYPGQLYGEKISKTIDHKFFTQGFDYIGFWMYRIKYYSEIYKKRPLEIQEICELKTMYEILFECMGDFYNIINKESDEYYFIRERLNNYDMVNAYQLILSERKKFDENPTEYIERVLKEGENHELYIMDTIPLTDRVDSSELYRIYLEEKNFWNKCARKSIFFTVFNSKTNINKICKSIWGKDKTFFYNWLYRLNGFRDYKKFLTFEADIPIPSLGKQIQFMFEMIENRDKDKPFIYMMHSEEAHYFNTFLSYDINDYEILKQETEVLKRDLKKVNNNYRGYIQYRQAIVYTDFWIKKMFSELENRGLLNNTVVLITADHGSSYCYEPVRNERMVTNPHTENYHIPMFLFDSTYGPKKISGYHNSKDVLPTVLELCNLEKPKGFTGSSMLSGKDDSTICDSEYMGTGCPDLRLRPIQYVARNCKYLVAYECMAKDEFGKGNITAVYDLQNDKDELNNLVDNIESTEIQELLLFLSERHEKIRKQLF